MNGEGHSSITQLLRAWSDGKPDALKELITLVYPELKGLANRQIARMGPGQTLQATALVNEAYLRLSAKQEVSWNDRLHFYAVASQLMRGILVDHARAQGAAKRGGGAFTVALDEGMALAETRDIDVLALDQALKRLAELDEQPSRIVELRFFGGLSLEEVSSVLAISVSTVKRDWVIAKTWIRRELMKSA